MYITIFKIPICYDIQGAKIKVEIEIEIEIFSA